jgi:hypothetical protein
MHLIFFFVCPYTLGKKHYIRFAIGVVFLIVIFGRVILIGRVLLFHLQETIILKNLGGFILHL